MKNCQNKKGFTLLEVVVSIGLLILVFGSVVSLAILTREAEQASKNNLIATYLAQEAQSLVRYQRDKNYFDLAPPFTSLVSEEVDNSIYYFSIDYIDGIRSSSFNNVELVPVMKMSPSGYYIDGGAGTETIFKRLVTTTYHMAAGLLPAYIDVKVDVFWKSDTKSNTYTLNSQLTDWR